MPTFDEVWTDKMLTGIQHIDDHHRHLVKLLIDAYNAVESGGSAELSRDLVSRLVSYSKYHFAAEERLMLETKYPRLQEQREAHRWFIEQLDGHFLTLSSTSPTLGSEVFAFLRGWYSDHVLKHDSDIGAHIRSQK